MFRPRLLLACLGLALSLTPPPTFADDPPTAVDDLDRELQQREALRRIRDAPGVTTPSRAEEILRARDLVREEQERRLLEAELNRIGLSENPLTGTPPTDEQLAQLRALAARIREQVGASVRLDAVDDYLDAVEERLANLALDGVDVYRRPRNFSPEELKTLAAVAEKYPRTNVARRARLVQQELALGNEFEAMKIEIDPDSEVGRTLDRTARSQLSVALQLVPQQRLQRLRDLADIFAGTRTAVVIERELEATKLQIEENQQRRQSRKASAEAESRYLRGYWDGRYRRTR